MAEIKKEIEDLMHNLAQERDELRVQVHLAKMEASDEWVELEEKLEKFEKNAKELGVATGEASQSIGAAAKLLGEEIASGFKKIASKL